MQRVTFTVSKNTDLCGQDIHNIHFQSLPQGSIDAWRQRLTLYISKPIHPLVMNYAINEESVPEVIQLRLLLPYSPIADTKDQSISMRVRLCWRLIASVAALYSELDKEFLCPAALFDTLPVEELDPAHFSYDKEIDLFRVLLHPRVALEPPRDNICVSSLVVGPCSSPEVLHGGPGSTQSVMWSLGCLLYRICNGSYPFGDDRSQVLPAILSTLGPSALPKRASTLVEKVPLTLRPLVAQLLAYRPSDRPTPTKLLLHPKVCDLLSKVPFASRTLLRSIPIGSLLEPPLDVPQPLVLPSWLQKPLTGRSDGLSSLIENSLESILLDLPDYLPIAHCGFNGMCEGFVLKNRSTGIRVFCKVYRIGDDSVLQNAITEYFAELASISHPYIVPLSFGKISSLNTYAYEAVEAASLHRLSDVVGTLDRGGLCEQKVWSLLIAVVDVLCMLQTRSDGPLCHHAIRPWALYLTQEGDLRLLDTGSALRFAKKLTQPSRCGHLALDKGLDPFTAPELRPGSAQSWVGGSRADLWELAQTICHLCRGDIIACSTLDDAQAHLRGHFLGLSYSDELHGVLAGMLQPDPVARTALSMLATHPCIRQKLRSELVHNTLRRSPLQHAIFSCDEAMVLQRMRTDAGGRDAQGCTALFLAAQRGMHQLLNLLVGAEADIADSRGRTALMAAAANNRVGCIDRLLPFQHGRQDFDGDTALIYAARFWATDALSLLRTEARLQNKRGETALMVAAASNYVEGVEALLLYEARAQTVEGWTALMCAAVVGATAAVCQLVTVEAGLRNNRGRTALIEAVLCGQMASVHVLAPLEHGAIDAAGRCALMYAASRGHTPAIRILCPLEGDVLDPSGCDYRSYGETDCLL